MSFSITEQEMKIIEYLRSQQDREIEWQELAQFSKDPSTVKKKTLQKSVSEIKRKYTEVNLPLPFKTVFKSATVPEKSPVKTVQMQGQNLVQLAKPTKPVEVKPSEKKPAQLEFELDKLTKRVKTRYGAKQLNDSEWDVFKYIHANAGRIIPISELRDKVVFPQYGSKLPARWFDSIMRIINNLRRQVDGLQSRLLTVKSEETSYLFQ